jgi:hypothetical protein
MLYNDNNKIKEKACKQLVSQLAVAGAATLLLAATTVEATPPNGTLFTVGGEVNDANTSIFVQQGTWGFSSSVYIATGNSNTATVIGTGSGDMLEIEIEYAFLGPGSYECPVSYIDLTVRGLFWEGEPEDAVPGVIVTAPTGWSELTTMFSGGDLLINGTHEGMGTINSTFTFQFVHEPTAEVPEPGTWALMGSMLAAAGTLRRKERAR